MTTPPAGPVADDPWAGDGPPAAEPPAHTPPLPTATATAAATAAAPDAPLAPPVAGPLPPTDAAPAAADAPAAAAAPVLAAEPADQASAVEQPRAAAAPVEDASAETPEEPDAPASRGPSWPLVLLAAAVAALLVATALLAVSLRRQSQTDRARQEALVAAKAAGAVLLSYDYRHLEADFARAKALTTGVFRGQYGDTTSKVVGPPALQYHAVVTAEVTMAGVVSAAPHAAVVLLFVNQTTTSTRVVGQKLDLNRVRLTMQETGGRWLVSKVEAL